MKEAGVSPDAAGLLAYFRERRPTADDVKRGNRYLVVSNQAGLLEVDRAGKTVWNLSVATSLWRAHRR